MAAIHLREILSEKDINRAARVPKIINKTSGEVIYRNSDPSQKWPLVVDNAFKKPDEFQVYEDELVSPSDEEGNIVWEEPDLRLKSMPELRKIGQNLSVTSNSKEKIIELIIKKQKMLA
jgi:hypothetical protein